jgi:ribosome recycling factor
MEKEILSDTKQRMQKTLEDLTSDLATIRTGRASVHLLDQVSVDYYGNPTPVNQLATLHAPEPSLITVQPYDTSQIDQIEKAILKADLGLNPSLRKEGKPWPNRLEKSLRNTAPRFEIFVEMPTTSSRSC